VEGDGDSELKPGCLEGIFWESRRIQRYFADGCAVGWMEIAMAKQRAAQQKRRTREHVIASQSVIHVERFIVDEGYTAERVEHDYGYDLTMVTYDSQGYVENNYVLFQLKGTDSMKEDPDGNSFWLQMSIEDYNLWIDEPMPVYFVLYDAIRRRAYWLYIQRYFAEDPSRGPRAGAQSVRIHIPKANLFRRRTVRMARDQKNEIIRQIRGQIDHVK
jgi:hypothetical protein